MVSVDNILKEKALKVIYICFGFAIRSAVIDSQVINMIERLHNSGVNIRLVTFDGFQAWKQNKNIYKQRIERVKKITGHHPAYFILPFPSHPISVALANIILIMTILPDLVKKQDLIIHSRGEQGILAAKWVKKLFHNVELLYDARGAIVEEYIYLAKSSGVKIKKIERISKRLKHRVSLAIELADKITCVSSRLLEYFASSYDLSGKKTSVIQCSADERQFYYDAKIRKIMRRKLNLENKTVLVYSGSVYRWQVIDKIVILFDMLNKFSKEKLFLLFLTTDIEQAQGFFSKNLSSSQYLVANIDHSSVPSYLMASDMGILLREQHLLNFVASPTKFAEYLMCGLPVIMSDNIGDTGKIIGKYKFGIIIDDLSFSQETINSVTNYLFTNRQSSDFISKISSEILSKRTAAEKLIRLYRS